MCYIRYNSIVVMSTSTSSNALHSLVRNLWVLCLLLSLYPIRVSLILPSSALFVHFFSTSPSIMVIGWFFSHIFFLLFFVSARSFAFRLIATRYLHSAHIVRLNIVCICSCSCSRLLYMMKTVCVFAKEAKQSTTHTRKKE